MARIVSVRDVWRRRRIAGRGKHSDEQGRNSTRLNDFDSIFDQLKLQISYNNLKFGQNRNCRGKEDLQLSFWAKVDSKLEILRKTGSNLAKSKVTMRTRLALMTVISLD